MEKYKKLQKALDIAHRWGINIILEVDTVPYPVHSWSFDDGAELLVGEDMRTVGVTSGVYRNIFFGEGQVLGGLGNVDKFLKTEGSKDFNPEHVNFYVKGSFVSVVTLDIDYAINGRIPGELHRYWLSVDRISSIEEEMVGLTPLVSILFDGEPYLIKGTLDRFLVAIEKACGRGPV